MNKLKNGRCQEDNIRVQHFKILELTDGLRDGRELIVEEPPKKKVCESVFNEK
jgi:hypothetical protein